MATLLPSTATVTAMSIPFSVVVPTMPMVPIDNTDYGSFVQVSMWSALAISALPLSMRLYCKIYKRLLWWDDHLLLLSWIFLFVDVLLVNSQVARGFGKPFTQQQPDGLVNTIKIGLVAATFALAATGLSKTSFALTLLRLTTGKIRKFIWFIIISINVFVGIIGLFVWIQCIPLAKSWDIRIPGTCWDPNIGIVYAKFASAWSGTMDIVLALLPWKVIWGLKMCKKERLGVAVAMSLGVFAGITAYIKLMMIIDAMDPNFSSEGVRITVWGTAEPAATIAAASIPVLRILFVKDRKRTRIETPYADATGRFTLTQKSQRSKITEVMPPLEHELVVWRASDDEEKMLKKSSAEES